MNAARSRNDDVRALPWWTWIVPLVFIELGDQLSLLFKYSESFAAFYLPTAIALVLVYWWGPARVLPSFFIIATLNSAFYGIRNHWVWLAFGIAETFSVFLSWYLFSNRIKGRYWMPDMKNTILFLSIGIFVPILVEVIAWTNLYLYDGLFEESFFWTSFSRDLLSELIVSFCVVLPALYFLTPFMESKGLLRNAEVFVDHRHSISKKNLPEIGVIFCVLWLLTYLLPFERFWFVYGLFSLYLAIRFGFGMALLGNTYLFTISYLIPFIIQNFRHQTNTIKTEETLTFLFLGSLLLYLFSMITGRVISDLKSAEEKLNAQNEELKETNRELDRFVYSVSHDLSAPLKSILGLVNISKISNDARDHQLYFEKIGTSAGRLDAFIKEILDYSFNKRKELIIEEIHVGELCHEILDNLKYMEGSHQLIVNDSELALTVVKSDRARLKIILNNLLTNALKYQKHTRGHIPSIKISSRNFPGGSVIEIEDNGEGIRPEVQDKIFDMFFRGHEKSVGSGLGLYIAKEASEKIGAAISVRSVYGTGSVFSIKLKE